MSTVQRTDRSGLLRAALFYGSLWGFAEATLGFLLHLIQASSVAGMILFPVGLTLMIGAYRSTERSAAMLLCAVVAAAVKVSSLILPVVSFRYVRNPALAILLEGLVSFAAVGLVGLPRGLRVLPLAVGASLAWRLLFLLVNLVLGITDGILSKGNPALIRYLVLDTAVNAALITAVLTLVGAARKGELPRLPRPKPAVVAVACAAALTAEMVLGLL